jgi:branched-chain amino acid transport system permease protein
MVDVIAAPPRRFWIGLKSGKYVPIVMLIALLALVPVASTYLHSPFLIRVFTRVVIFSMAAVSLNLVLGFGGLISLLHAGLFGIGAYTVAILAQQDFSGELILGLIPGTSELLISIPVALIATAIAACILGAVSLRTSGAYFIMITLAFNQMLYYFFVSLQKYGGDDGQQILSSMTVGGFDGTLRIPFYYICLAALSVTILVVLRVVESRFGLVLRAAAQNERRVVAVGLSPFRYKLVAFAISGALTGMAGGLWANAQQFVSPADMSWIRSGDFVMMAVLGGTSYVAGPVVGAIAYLLMQFVLSLWTTYSQLPFGLLIILVVVGLKKGLVGAGQQLFEGPRRPHG